MDVDTLVTARRNLDGTPPTNSPQPVGKTSIYDRPNLTVYQAESKDYIAAHLGTIYSS